MPRIQYAPNKAGLVVGFGVSLAGVFVMAASFNVFGGVTEGKTAVMLWVGSLFLGGGLMLLARMWKHWRWSREAKTRSEGWRRDYDWPARGMRDDSGRTLLYHATGLLFVAAFLGLFHYMLWREWGRDGAIQGVLWAFVFGVGLFDLVLTLSAGFFLYRLAQWLRFGRAEILYQGAPFRPGGDMRLRFRGSPALASSDAKLVAQLRCVEDRVRVSGSGDNQSRNIESMMLYEETLPLAVDSRGAADVVFSIPAGRPGTNLGNPDDFTRYWEVVVRAAMPGVDYEGVFLVPVYKGE